MKAEDKNMEFQILESAEKLFLEQGFAKTTTGQIAKLAAATRHWYIIIIVPRTICLKRYSKKKSNF